MSSIVEDLKWRYACKQFDKKRKISQENLEIILESLRLTPSSFGLQPWKFVLVEKEELREQLLEASWNQAQVKDASHLLVLCAPKSMDEAFIDRYITDMANTREQDPEELAGFKKMLMMIPNKSEEDRYQWAKNQIYIALGSLMTVCAHLRIDACPMEGFVPAKYDNILGLEKYDLMSMVVCPLGYRNENDKYASLKKVRFAKKDLVMTL